MSGGIDWDQAFEDEAQKNRAGDRPGPVLTEDEYAARFPEVPEPEADDDADADEP